MTCEWMLEKSEFTILNENKLLDFENEYLETKKSLINSWLLTYYNRPQLFMFRAGVLNFR